VFTGIVEHVGTIAELRPTGEGMRLWVEAPDWEYRPVIGDSVCVAGCCLTVADRRPGAFAFDVVPRTLAKTTLGRLGRGSKVNLERAATVGSLLGGHLVQGHIDGVGKVVSNAPRAGEGWRLVVEPEPDLMAYMTPAGSVCIDGVSLTLAGVDVGAGRIEVALIPTTIARTTLAGLSEGHTVNIECDAIARTVVHYLRHFGGR
jgi:riboflavin synthase